MSCTRLPLAAFVIGFASINPALADAPPLAGGPTVIRQRVVALNDAEFAAPHAASFTLALFDDRVVTFERLSRREAAPGRVTLRGRFAGFPLSQATIVVADGAIAASIQLTGSEQYAISPAADGAHLISQLAPESFPSCGGALPVPTSAQRDLRAAPRGNAAARSDCAAQIDILVLYTAAARSAAGGEAGMAAVVGLCVDNLNLALANSQVDASFRLVHSDEVGDPEDPDFIDNLYQLTDPVDGIYDEAHTLREQYGADMVALLIDDLDYCGVAFLLDNYDFADYAFSVSNWWCGAYNLTFAHEVGHNLSCHHDRANAGDAFFDYAYGWRWFGDSGTEWRTVMAYSPGTRVPHYSHPDIFYDGQPTGVPIGSADEAHNAAALVDTTPYVAEFRAPVCPNATAACIQSDIYPECTADCVVDLSDLGVVLANFAPGAGGKSRAEGDVYPVDAPDGLVDLSDLGQVLSDYGADCR